MAVPVSREISDTTASNSAELDATGANGMDIDFSPWMDDDELAAQRKVERALKLLSFRNPGM